MKKLVCWYAENVAPIGQPPVWKRQFRPADPGLPPDQPVASNRIARGVAAPAPGTLL